MTKTTTKELPILFSAPMVQAILAGTKTQTRRVIKPQPKLLKSGYSKSRNECQPKCPYGLKGHRLWVRETAKLISVGPGTTRGVYYPADGEMGDVHFYEKPEKAKDMKPSRNTPGIHMPRWASRILLEIKDIRLERLNDITLDDCKAEGIASTCDADYVQAYQKLWNRLNGSGAWGINPWVWVIEFNRVK